MAFTFQGSLHGGTNGFIIQKFPISNLAVRKGALLTYAAGASSVSLFTTDTAVPVLGIACHATTTASTEIDVQILPTGSIVMADIEEIIDGTTLTATSGSTTTFADTSFVATKDNDVLIGAKFEVLSMNSTDQPVGTILTATDYTTSGGIIQFATLGTTGFKTGDTIKLVSVSSRLIGAQNCAINATTADSITFNGTGAGDGDFCRVLGVSDDGKKLKLVITAGWDLVDALA